MSLLLLLSDSSPPGADISFNGPMLTMPYSLQRLGFTYTRNSLKTVYQNNALVTLSANQFGTTYDSVTGLNAFEAEPAATNLVTYSSDFSNAIWTKDEVTLSASQTGPDGAASATKIIPSVVSSSGHRIRCAITPSSGAISFFVKASGYSWIKIRSFTNYANFNVSTGVKGQTNALSSSIVHVGDGWYRCSMAFTAASSLVHYLYVASSDNASVDSVAFAGDGTSGIIAYGAQIESGSRATSYIATAGATATRAADVLSTATANIPGFNAAGYTLVVDGRADVSTGTLRYSASVNDGTANNFAAITRQAASTVGTETVSGGVSQAAVNEVSPGTARRKVSYSVAANSFLRAVNGTAGTADTGGSMPVAPTTLNIGHHLGGSQTNGFIYGFKLIPVALNQAQTTAQTS